MSDSGDKELDKRRELEAEREHYKPTPSQDWLDGIIDGIVDYVDSGHTGIGRPTTTISPEAAKKLITHRMKLERIDELKAYKRKFATDLSVEAYEGLADRISKLEGESTNASH